MDKINRTSRKAKSFTGMVASLLRVGIVFISLFAIISRIFALSRNVFLIEREKSIHFIYHSGVLLGKEKGGRDKKK